MKSFSVCIETEEGHLRVRVLHQEEAGVKPARESESEVPCSKGTNGLSFSSILDKG